MASYVQAQALLNRGVSRPTLYSVRLPQQYIKQDTNTYLDFFCAATSVPEVRTQTIVALGHEYMGIEREQPVGVQYGKPFEITVIENSDFMVYKELRAWFDGTANNANQVGGRNIRMQYYESYVADMELIKLEQAGDPNTNPTALSGELLQATDNESVYKQPLRIKFINAYPVSIGAIVLASSEYDQFTTFSASFSYESYQIVPVGGALNPLNK